MTSIPESRKLHFMVTGQQPCPYLPDRQERKIVAELPIHHAQYTFDHLSKAGFRRTHRVVYRPACKNCDKCIPARINIAGFHPNHTQKKIINRNRDLLPAWTAPIATEIHYNLFANYVRNRHSESDMTEMSYPEFVAMIEDTPVTTSLLELRTKDNVLLGACLVDQSADGFSAVYSYFDPSERRRGIGIFLILALIEAGRAAGLPYLYLGYWIASSKKMAYKSQFSAFETLTSKGWA